MNFRRVRRRVGHDSRVGRPAVGVGAVATGAARYPTWEVRCLRRYRYRRSLAHPSRASPRPPGACTTYLRRLLLRNRRSLKPWWRTDLMRWLDRHHVLRELYEAKESLHRLYRIRGHARAKRALMGLIDTFALSAVPELQTLRRTLIKWRKEILAYFYSGRLTNARTEGFNLKAKLVKRRVTVIGPSATTDSGS